MTCTAGPKEQLLASELYSSTSNIITLNVMSNDLGGNAKTLWSIDDGNGITLAPDHASFYLPIQTADSLLRQRQLAI